MANNPIKYTDLVKPDDSIKSLITELETLATTYIKNMDAIKAKADILRESLKGFPTMPKLPKEEIDEAAKAAEGLKKAMDANSQAYSDNAKQIAALKVKTNEQNQISKLNAKLADSAEGSYNRLSAQYSLNKIALNKLSAEERTSTEAGKELEQQTEGIYDEMKKLQEATGKYTLDVGNYSKGWAGVKDSLSGASDQMAAVPGPAGAAAGGLQGIAVAAKALLANPIILLIAALVTALVGLVNLFGRTKTGSDLFAKGLAVLDGILSVLVGAVDNLFKGLQYLFTKPVESLKAFGNFIVSQIINRFTALIYIVKAAGAAMSALWGGDMKGLKEAAKDAGTALVQLQTGLDAQQQREFAKAVSDTTKSIIDQANAFAQLEQARRDNRTATRELQKELEDLVTQEELVRKVADDNTKSFAEREAAAKNASSLTQQRAKVERQIASEALALINREVELRTKNGEQIEDLLDQQLSAYQALKQADRTYLNSVSDNQKRESELKQDRLERDLDILIDGFDNQKTINEQLIADDTKTFDERKRILEETKNLSDESFRAQISTIQQFTGVQVDANELINESNATVLNEKIRSLGLSEIIEGRLLEIVRDRKSANQDLAQAEIDLTKAQTDAEEKAADDRAKALAKQIKDEQEAQKEIYEAKRSTIDSEYDLRLSEIDSIRGSEAEKTRLRLEAERDRLQKILALNVAGGKDLSQVEVDTVKNIIAGITSEMNKLEKEEVFDIYSAVGLKMDDEQRGAIEEATQFALDQFSEILDANTELAEQAVTEAEERVSTAQAALDAEIEARNNGYASNVAQAQKDLELEKQNLEKQQEEYEKAQKAQALLDTVTQTSSLITASANIWSSLSAIPVVGVALALAAVGTMWGSFAASKIKAAQVTKAQSYGDGGFEFLSGGSHQSGNDINIGNMPDGRPRRAEGGETMAIINKSSTRRYRALIPDIVSSLNKGIFESKYLNSYQPGESFGVHYSFNTKTLENDVREIRNQNRKKTYVDGRGRNVTEYKNLKTICS